MAGKACDDACAHVMYEWGHPPVWAAHVCCLPLHAQQDNEPEIDLSVPLSHANFELTLARYPIGERPMRPLGCRMWAVLLRASSVRGCCRGSPVPSATRLNPVYAACVPTVVRAGFGVSALSVHPEAQQEDKPRKEGFRCARLMAVGPHVSSGSLCCPSTAHGVANGNLPFMPSESSTHG